MFCVKTKSYGIRTAWEWQYFGMNIFCMMCSKLKWSLTEELFHLGPDELGCLADKAKPEAKVCIKVCEGDEWKLYTMRVSEDQMDRCFLFCVFSGPCDSSGATETVFSSVAGGWANSLHDRPDGQFWLDEQWGTKTLWSVLTLYLAGTFHLTVTNCKNSLFVVIWG